MGTPKLSSERHELLRAKVDAASAALFALEEAFPPDDQDRRALYRIRVELGWTAHGILGERPMSTVPR